MRLGNSLLKGVRSLASPALGQVPPGSSYFSGVLHEALCIHQAGLKQPVGRPTSPSFPVPLLEAPVCRQEGLSRQRLGHLCPPRGCGPVPRQPQRWPCPLLSLQYGKRENSRLWIPRSGASLRQFWKKEMGGGAPNWPVPSSEALGAWLHPVELEKTSRALLMSGRQLPGCTVGLSYARRYCG